MTSLLIFIYLFIYLFILFGIYLFGLFIFVLHFFAHLLQFRKTFRSSSAALTWPLPTYLLSC